MLNLVIQIFQKYSNYEVFELNVLFMVLFELLFELESDPVQIRK